jgi:hypothetical protein
MDRVENERVANSVVSLDDKIFRNCYFRNCELIYGGGNVDWADCTFTQCRITLVECAARTSNFLKAWGFKIIAPNGTEYDPAGSVINKSRDEPSN